MAKGPKQPPDPRDALRRARRAEERSAEQSKAEASRADASRTEEAAGGSGAAGKGAKGSGGSDEAAADPVRDEMIRTGKVSLPTEVDEARARLAAEGIDPDALDDAAVLAADEAQEAARTKAALDDLLRARTGKDPDTLTEAEKGKALRNEVLEQSGAADRLREGRHVIGAEDPLDQDDDDIQADLAEIGSREFVAAHLGKPASELTSKDFAEFDAMRDRLAVEAETGRSFDSLSGVEVAQARSAIRNREFDLRVTADDPPADAGGGVPGFGDHSGRGSLTGARPGTGFGGSGGGDSGGGSGGGGGDGGGSGGGGTGGGTDTSGGGRPGTDPFAGGGLGGGTTGGGTTGGGGGAAGGGAPGTGGGGTGGGGATGGGGGGTGGGGDPGGTTTPTGGSTGGSGGSTGESGEGGLRAAEITLTDGTTVAGFITPEGDLVDGDGNPIPADDVDSVAVTFTVDEDDTGDDDTGADGDTGGDDDTGGDTGGDDSGSGDDGTDDAAAGGGVEFTPNPDGAAGPPPGVSREELEARLPRGAPDTETQPTEEGGFVKPPPGTPIPKGPGVDQPGPDGFDGPRVITRPVGGVPNPDSGVIDPPDDVDDLAFGAGAVAAPSVSAPAAARLGAAAIADDPDDGPGGAPGFGGSPTVGAVRVDALDTAGDDLAFGGPRFGSIADDDDLASDVDDDLGGPGDDDPFDLDG